MTYTISDLHGRYDKYLKLLQKINLGPDDTLYVLGDVIDRGPYGFKIMLDMAQRPNVIGLLGNHEAMAIDALRHILGAVQQDEEVALTGDDADSVRLWFYNGGELSLSDFLSMDADQAQTVWKYMREMPLYKEVHVKDRKFVLVHGGLEGFTPSRPLEDYKPDEILWCRPEADTVYYPDKMVIFGHTPVQLLGFDNLDLDHPAKIYRWGNLVDIDCGCVFRTGRLGCLCLDTMEEIYV